MNTIAPSPGGGNSSVGWSDALAGALTLMVVVAGPEIAEEVMIRDTFEDACRRADRKHKPDARLDRLGELVDNDIGLEAVCHNVVALKAYEAPAATVEALVFQLRSGVDALSNQGALTRLSRLSEPQARAVAERVRNFKPNIAPAWGLDEVEALLTIWSLRHGR